jgi:hypothetical protein
VHYEKDSGEWYIIQVGKDRRRADEREILDRFYEAVREETYSVRKEFLTFLCRDAYAQATAAGNVGVNCTGRIRAVFKPCAAMRATRGLS